MPLFMLFKTDFKEKKAYMEYLDKRCKENGFNGLYLIETCATLKEYKVMLNSMVNPCKRIFLREPGFSNSIYRNKLKYQPKRIYYKLKKAESSLLKKQYKVVKIFDGNDMFDCMINFKVNSEKVIRGIFFEWDNTPRHSYRGYIITAPKYDKFKEYYEIIKNNDYLFINAWNEWCEGMILEPTVKNKYKYLEWIRSVKK